LLHHVKLKNFININKKYLKGIKQTALLLFCWRIIYKYFCSQNNGIPNFHVFAGFLSDLKSCKFSHSFDGMDRLFRGHGHTLHDIYILRVGMFSRIPDIVVWPGKLSNILRYFLPSKIYKNNSFVQIKFSRV